ncbi:MAG: biopolymer transporter ExbD [Gemmatimonadaceae bacterium]|nr:biopolymer transporter ExbD [Gemmatimonadaceae bacterium]
MSVGGGSSNLNNEPNVVPMIDIMLVLLIIFMIMQPMMRKAVDLQLPDPTPAVVTANQASDQIVLEILADGSFAINREPLTLDRLGARLTEVYENRPDKIIFVKGDPTVKYQDVIHAMDIARGAGVKVIGIPPKDTK